MSHQTGRLHRSPGPTHIMELNLTKGHLGSRFFVTQHFYHLHHFPILPLCKICVQVSI
ncbi:MAG: hypothetical protein NVS3B14_12740 [Ktedonobacteraceae bacterium]